MAVTEPRPANRAPRRQPGQWGGFVHLLARFYMDYHRAVIKAARRKGHRKAVDIDTQHSKEGTPWCFHWATLGKNKCHDPHGQYGKNTRIDHMTDAELSRIKGPKGQPRYKLITLLLLCAEHGVRAEVEVKEVPNQAAFQAMIENSTIQNMLHHGLLQVKTLAGMAGAVARLTPIHGIGIPTILSFDKYRGPGVSKHEAWPVTDYVRGHAKWVA